ncbi:type II secretion system protein GspG [Haloferula sp. BvORR071]|uniref:type II secretion system protein GspG n=1 Tax=Haloferula sp. BvORR071 TaxID=1396141 RepID=UPI002240FCB1|nr:type II secretion system protein GspG [Haloferula sp. BvORR071]
MRVRSDFNSMRSAIQTYRINAGQYPSTEQGLSALVTRPETNPQPKKWIQVFVKIPPDPWGRDYRYKALPEDDKRGFEIISAGKDGVFGTKDDLSSVDDW